MKLNPRKCVFGVIVGKFLGFMVSQRGIEVNLEKVWAIMQNNGIKLIRVTGDGQMPPLFPHIKEVI